MVLMGDKEYDQGHVVKVLCKVIAGLGACVRACFWFCGCSCGWLVLGATSVGRHSIIIDLTPPYPNAMPP